MPQGNRKLAIYLIFFLALVGLFRFWVGQLIPDEFSDYDFREISVTTLDNKLLRITYPSHLFPEKEASSHSRVSFILLDPYGTNFPPTVNPSLCPSFAVTINTPIPTVPATQPLLVQPTQSTQDNTVVDYYFLDNPDGGITFLDEEGNLVTNEVILSNDHSPKFIYLGTNNPNLMRPQKTCIYVSGTSLAEPIPIAIDVDKNISKFYKDIVLGLNATIVFIIYQLLLDYYKDIKKKAAEDETKIEKLKNHLDNYIANREWGGAYELSKKNWIKSKNHRSAIKETWKKGQIKGSTSSSETRYVWTFVNAHLEEIKLQEKNQEINYALKYILTSLLEFPSLSRAVEDFVKKQNQQFIDPRIRQLITKLRNRIWLAFSHNWEKKEIINNVSVQKTLQDLRIPNPFLPDSCECNYEQAMATFCSRDDIRTTLEKHLFAKLNIDMSPHLSVVESEKQGGRSTLGIWCLKEIFKEIVEKERNLYFFPIYIRITNDLSLDTIERQIAEHILSYLSLIPEDYLKANLRGAKDAIAFLIKSQLDFVEIKSRIESLARDFGSNRDELDNLINIIEKYKKEAARGNEEERIRNISLSLPGVFQGLLLIIDFSAFTQKEKEYLEELYAKVALANNISVLALIPLLREPYQLNVKHQTFTLKYTTEDITKMLENRLKQHQYSGNIDNLLTSIFNHIPNTKLNFSSKQFISAAQGNPGLLFSKGEDLLEKLGDRNSDLLVDVYSLFYVPDHIFRVRGEKSIMDSGHSDLTPIADFIQSLNKLESVQYVEYDWKAQLTLRVKSVYEMGPNNGDGVSRKIELFFYEIKYGYVKGQPAYIERVRQDIVRNLSKLEKGLVSQNDLTSSSSTPYGLTLVKKERGLLLRISPKSVNTTVDRKYIYIDRRFDYMVAIKNFEEADEEYLEKLIDNFYDWN